ncbi:hypothetical protein WA026_009833 [Henosepilachna vigintioctopunctata]|uniref:Uncharacterized protein n=1 Tax=Henosepilachna vigintioctopunctata TaxID=420089 RepID=A0AAW1TSX8_9CUCU
MKMSLSLIILFLTFFVPLGYSGSLHILKNKLLPQGKGNAVEAKKIDSKKTITRNWGANGMPFNVLYMKPPHKTFRNVKQVKIMKTQKPKMQKPAKYVARMSSLRISSSMIPTFFISQVWKTRRH